MNWVQSKETTIEDLVTHNTGMTLEELINDKKVYSYPGIDEAAELFLSHVKRGSIIRVWCDYDTDGVCCNFIQTYTIARPLKIRNITIECPGRYTDGYGVKPSTIERFHGTNLLVLCDNGIAAVEAVDLARNMGMDVIILDHHEPRVIDGKVVLPNANVIVDPHVTGGDFEDLCGAGVSHYFGVAVRKKCTWMSDKQRWYLEQISSIGAAFGTVGDVVNLTRDNRRIVKQGLANLNKGMGTSGIKMLLKQLYLNRVTSTDIGFGISPVINAYGRLEDQGPKRICNILCNDASEPDATAALEKEVQLAIEMNKKRKILTKEAKERAIANYEENGGNDNFIICYDEWSISGIVGLVASELVETYKKPALVFAPAKEDGVIKGSGRSVEGIDIKSLLDQAAKYLTAYGGHPMACGATTLLDNLDDLGDKLNQITPVVNKDDVTIYNIETTLEKAADLLGTQDKYEPYGEGNPLPVYRFNQVFLGQPSYMGQNSEHIKFSTGIDDIEIIWFHGREAYESLGSPEVADILGTMSYHEFKNETTIQFQVIDMKLI